MDDFKCPHCEGTLAKESTVYDTIIEEDVGYYVCNKCGHYDYFLE